MPSNSKGGFSLFNLEEKHERVYKKTGLKRVKNQERMQYCSLELRLTTIALQEYLHKMRSLNTKECQICSEGTLKAEYSILIVD